MSGFSILLSGLSALLSGLRVLLLPTHVHRLSAGLRHTGRQAYSDANKASEGPQAAQGLCPYNTARYHCMCVTCLSSSKPNTLKEEQSDFTDCPMY